MSKYRDYFDFLTFALFDSFKVAVMCDYQEQDILVKALQRGEEKVFVYLFDTYYEGLVNYAGRIVGKTDLACDLVQEVFVKLFENSRILHIESSVQAYLYKAVYHNCLNAVKHRKIVLDYERKQLLNFYHTEVLQTPEAEMALLSEDLGEAVREALEKLPDRCREIFLLSKMENLSNKEIASKLNISVKTVEAQMTKALSRLRNDLDWVLLAIFITKFLD